jgi:hypothetical protein
LTAKPSVIVNKHPKNQPESHEHLGLHVFGHDTGAALYREGRLGQC